MASTALPLGASPPLKLQRNTSALAVAIDGQFAVIAARERARAALCVVQLPWTSPTAPSVVVASYVSKWDVTSLAIRQELVASALNLKALVWSSSNWTSTPYSFVAHTRVITGVHWNTSEPLLATSSMDAYVHVWDVRRQPAVKPAASFCSWQQGAVAVRWSERTPHLIASAHGGDVRLWDLRNTSHAMCTFAAHTARVHSLDWARSGPERLVTCGLDRAVRVWSLDALTSGDSAPVINLDVPSPCARASFSPAGEAILTVSLRKENVGLWALNGNTDADQPVEGPSLVAQWPIAAADVAWRNGREFLILGKDSALTHITLPSAITQACGVTVPETPKALSPSPSSLSLNVVPDPTRVVTAAAEAAVAIKPRGSAESKAQAAMSSPLQQSSTSSPSTSTAGLRQYNLNDEFSLVNVNIPNVSVESIDATQRVCIVTGTPSPTAPTAATPSEISAPSPLLQTVPPQSVTPAPQQQPCRLRISFPSAYPFSVPPTFDFIPPVPLSPAERLRVLESLLNVAARQVRNNRGCLEPCLRAFVPAIDAAIAFEIEMQRKRASESDSDGAAAGEWPSSSAESLSRTMSADRRSSISSTGDNDDDSDSDTEAPLNKDDNIPFPRTSAAVFNGNGMLVCFASTFSAKNMFSSGGVPRSFEEMRRHLSLRRDVKADPGFLASASGLVTMPGLSDDLPRAGSSTAISSIYRRPTTTATAGTLVTSRVSVKDVSGLMPISRSLADAMRLDNGDPIELCKNNEAAAARAGRHDLVKVWRTAALLIAARTNGGNQSVEWGRHPMGRRMLLSIMRHFASAGDVQTLAILSCMFSERFLSPQLVRVPVPPPQPIKGKWTPGDAASRASIIADLHQQNESLSFFSSSDLPLLNYYRLLYAEILFNWGLLNLRAQILKFVDTPTTQEAATGISVTCAKCKKPVNGPFCVHCKNATATCSVCRVIVKGNVIVCVQCGHGGHAMHQRAWFSKSAVCATGCGCQCADFIQ